MEEAPRAVRGAQRERCSLALGTAPDQRVLAVLTFQQASVDRGRERGVVEDYRQVGPIRLTGLLRRKRNRTSKVSCGTRVKPGVSGN